MYFNSDFLLHKLFPDYPVELEVTLAALRGKRQSSMSLSYKPYDLQCDLCARYTGAMEAQMLWK